MTETAEAATAEKAKRGDGLVKTSFVDAQGKNDHKRVPEGVVAVLVNGKSYNVAAIPAAVQTQLVAFALATRAKTYVNNHADEAKNGSDVGELADKVFADLVAGKLYSATSEGPKAPKAFDGSMYVEAVRIGTIERGKIEPGFQPISDAMLAQLKTKIENDLSGKDRVAYLNRIKQDPFAGPAFKVLQAKAQMAANKANAGKENKKDVLSDLF